MIILSKYPRKNLRDIFFREADNRLPSLGLLPPSPPHPQESESLKLKLGILESSAHLTSKDSQGLLSPSELQQSVTNWKQQQIERRGSEGHSEEWNQGKAKHTNWRLELGKKNNLELNSLWMTNRWRSGQALWTCGEFFQEFSLWFCWALTLGEFTDDSTSPFCRPQRIGKLLGNHFKEFPISCGNFTIGKDNNPSPTTGLSEIVQRISCQHSCNVWISTPLRALFL